MNAVLTTCPFCPCGCGLYLQADGDRPTAVMPSEHHPISQGKLCARGWAAHEAAAWGERLTRPLLRRAGELRPCSWPDALAAAAAGLREAARGGGALGVLGSARATNEENYLACKLARGALATPNVDACLAATYRPLLDGVADITGSHDPVGALAGIADCHALLLVEGDVSVSHPRVAGAVMHAVRHGAALVTIGGRATRMSAIAAQHIVATPGRERATVSGLLAAALGGPLDTAAVVAAGEGFDALRRSAAGRPASAELAAAAERFAAARRAAIIVAPLPGDGDELRRLGRELAMLAAVTGHLVRGSCLLVLPQRGNLRGACEVGVAPDLLPGFAELADGRAHERLFAAWGRAPASGRGLAATEMISACRGLVVLADDPAATLAAGAAARAALASRDCVVVLDAFATPLLEAATVVLPIAAPAESDGTYTSLDGRLQRVRAAASPPGEARPGWGVLAELLSGLGYGAEYAGTNDVRRELAGVVRAYAARGTRELDDGWGVVVAGAERSPAPVLAALAPEGPSAAAATAVAWDGVFDWDADPLVHFSPTLSRDGASQRKLFPRGFVGMSKADADALGVRSGWAVRIASPMGEAVVPARLRSDLPPGVLLVPFGFRDALAGPMGGRATAHVTVARV